ncbi:MAG: asparaginase domain-containing protein [Methylicorpusculum sp.]|uniref:asparaginase n=1 Tax=Methylicorpusculum sp. TaxID=2713644 RepID=UPI002725D79C|nr:asparaginase domain-containing protein [Methylicorpusculum sp.]MDO8940442.1 asparaginase domain-containing protein [Methylicorpusculum sp.]
MKDILVVFTGGTIGSSNSEGTIDTDPSNSYKLIDLYRKAHDTEQAIQFKCLQPLQMLSENLHPRVWTTLINAVEAENPDQWAGIIITHGTDTLAYTAAALGLYFNKITVPLLLVSSNYPLDDGRANGLANFACAVEYIKRQMRAGVFVPYRNLLQTMHLHSGVRLASSLQLSGDFISVQFKHHMEYGGQGFIEMNEYSPKPFITNGPKLLPVFSDNIMMIKPYPGLNYSHLDLSGVDAVLHDLYHSGTACSSMQWGASSSLVAFVKRCRQEGLVVYLAPAIKSGAAYQSTHELMDAGAKMVWNMSIEAAYVKLCLAFGNYEHEQEIKDFMASDIAGELL